MLNGLNLYEHPFVYSLGMHIGHKLQNHLIKEAYNQKIENRLLNQLSWETDGYLLFTRSSLASSSRHGYFSPLAESNCFAMKKDDFIAIGGFDERFKSPGGGLVNLDYFKRVNEDKKYSPVMVLGEATFHQFHGGVATNVTVEEHPFEQMEEEYRAIRNKDYQANKRLPENIQKIKNHSCI
ncbi:MAG: hypothetical protein L3J66_11590 [Bacteroidales bacterium]|nr:hypothetical protein [Bacteroidales bacterium]